MSANWNDADDWIIGEAVRYQIVRRERQQAALPIVYVPLHLRTSQSQPDTAEVSFVGEASVVRMFNQPAPGVKPDDRAKEET